MTQEQVDKIKNDEFVTKQRLAAEAEELKNKPAPEPAEEEKEEPAPEPAPLTEQ